MTELNILIVEDDENLAKNLQRFISEVGKTTITYDGLEGELLGDEGIYDLAILDLMLPGMNGYDILKKWRQKKMDLPVLILTAKDTLNDKLKGFELGADDYLTKPFHREELLMRVKALLKRSGRLADNSQLIKGDFKVDLKKREVELKSKELLLNGKEYDLLIYFLQNPNTIITKDQIFNRLWGFESETSITVVEVYMSNLRKKIKKIMSEQPIKTIRNVGYLFQVENQ